MMRRTGTSAPSGRRGCQGFQVGVEVGQEVADQAQCPFGLAMPEPPTNVGYGVVQYLNIFPTAKAGGFPRVT